MYSSIPVSRLKEFDETEVLDGALDLFRKKGFHSTSFCDLTEGLGVSRQSLYDTYGDKEALFLAALQRYAARGEQALRQALSADGPVREILRKTFYGLIEQNCGGGSRGCLMVNSMVELAPQMPAVRALALSHARAIEGLFASRLSAAQRQGEIGSDRDPVALARFLYHTLLGLSAASRGLGDHNNLRQSAALAIGSLG